MSLIGKGMFMWQLHRILGGTVQRMVGKATEAGLTHVIIKIADGPRSHNVELVGHAADAFKAAGIQVWGWAWLWLEEPLQEAQVAAHQCQILELDGFVINAEHPACGRANEARAYMGALRDELPRLPLALSSYRYPQQHTTFPWEAFLSACDWDMPQMYWVGESPGDCVRRSLAQHQAFPFAKPIVATGAAYGEQYGNTYFRAAPREIIKFLDAARENGLSAANFWSWDWAEEYGPDLWDAVAAYEWPGCSQEIPDVAEQYWTALETTDLGALASLYHDNAVYITARGGAQGPDAIRACFEDLFGSLPNVQFSRLDLRVEGNVRILYWSATSGAGRIVNGLDTIGIRAGKIQYHSSSYQRTANG